MAMAAEQLKPGRADLIAVARGDRPADLVLKNARVINVFSGEIMPTDVAVYGGRVAGFGGYQARQIVDLEGRYLSPAFIDGHVHLESSMLTPPEYAWAVVPRGTTAVVADPHEIANVLGLEGIKFILESGRSSPLDVYVMLPSCVPATGMETSGASLGARDLALMAGDDRVLGIGELMNYPGVVAGDPDLLDKVAIGLARGGLVDGHAPGLEGRALQAYAAAGIRSDHESTSPAEALDRLRLGMYLMIREGSTARNLEALLPVVTRDNSRRCLLVTDDTHPEDLLRQGHMDHILRRAVALGLDPVTAIRMVTLNPAEYFGLVGRGAIAPGYRADMVVLDDLVKFCVRRVYRAGQLVAVDGRMAAPAAPGRAQEIRSSINVAWIEPEHFAIPARGSQARLIEVIPGQILTGASTCRPRVERGFVVADTERDILKIAVIERHLATGNTGVGLIRGFGLRQGAIASSVAHDSHNIIVVGTSDVDMLEAAVRVVKMRGGLAVADGAKTIAALPLPIAGLMSEQPPEEVAAGLDALNAAAAGLGCRLANPFMALSFLALPVIPHLKITDRGLVDVTRFEPVPLFVGERD